MHYVIIGNGGAGVSALRTIREIDKKSDISIISREKYPAYSPCSLPNLLGGEIDKQVIFRFDKKFYDRLNAKFIKNTQILQIIPKSKEVKISKEKVIKFDKLLIAIGANPIIPRGVKGLDLNGVYTMGSLDSTLGMLDQMKQGVNHVVVIGGGFIGIETAAMLRKQGLNVSIVEMLPHILSRMLDPDMSDKVVEILKKHGIRLVMNDILKCVNGKKNVNSITLKKDILRCDMLIIAIGVSPNVNILRGTGLSINKGVVVDSKMQTNIKNIYAAGDIAEVKDQIEGRQGTFAIWPNAIEQGRIAGLNMAGNYMEYDGAEMINVLDVFKIPVVAMGRTSKELGRCKAIYNINPDTSKKLLLKNNKIVGLQLVNTIKNAGTFYSLMKKGSNVSSIKKRLLDDNFVIAPDIVPSKIEL